MTKSEQRRFMVAYEALRYSCAEPVVKEFASWVLGHITTKEAAERIPFIQSLDLPQESLVIPDMGTQLDMFKDRQ